MKKTSFHNLNTRLVHWSFERLQILCENSRVVFLPRYLTTYIKQVERFQFRQVVIDELELRRTRVLCEFICPVRWLRDFGDEKL